LTTLTAGKRLGKRGELIRLAGPCSHQLAAAALDSADHAVDVIVAHAADVVFGRFSGGLGQT
jgi:hypothetical protein